MASGQFDQWKSWKLRDITKDFCGRSAALKLALTLDFDELKSTCKRAKTPSSLYGSPDGKWCLLSEDSPVPMGLPRPPVGVNVMIREMEQKAFVEHIAQLSREWLIDLMYFIGDRSKEINPRQLFDIGSVVPDILEEDCQDESLSTSSSSNSSSSEEDSSYTQGFFSSSEPGGPGSASRRQGSEPFVMKVLNNKVMPLHPPPGDTSNEKTLQIDGTAEQIEVAKQMVYEFIENRLASAGGYSQKAYQAQQTGGSGHMQQLGTYPGAPSLYNMAQQPLSGYPPHPASVGYAQNWDLSSLPQSQSGNTQGTGYDYYAQQQMPSQPEQSASGSQNGYEQPPENRQPGYDQQYGYSSTLGYGNVTNPPSSSRGETGQVLPSQQGYTGQPRSNLAYPNLAGYETQAGYGAPSAVLGGGYGTTYGFPQGQRTPPIPSSYGQPQQSPSQASGYTQPSTGQPGYPSLTTMQPRYGQPDYGVIQPSVAYPSAYSTPPILPSYRQHPSYYGGAYAQPPAYPTDSNVAALAPAPVPAPAPAQGSQPSSQPSGAAKTSPQS